jgi:hypothetical protein
VITALHGAIHVSDLPTSSTYQVAEPAEEVLAMVLPPKREVEEVPEEAAEPAAAPVAAAAEEAAPEADASEAPAQSESEAEPA